MKIENICVFGFEPALRGMRNSRESWDKSDSKFHCAPFPGDIVYPNGSQYRVPENPQIGPVDMGLICKLIKGGTEHRKFLRQIMIWWDLTIPRYVWQEMDTYKVSTVRNSVSSMDKLGARDLTQDDFQLPVMDLTLDRINYLARLLRDAKKENAGVRDARRQLKNELPEGYLQKSTHSLNYETALTILKQRHNHRLDEWNLSKEGSICQTIIELPYMKEFAAAWGIPT